MTERVELLESEAGLLRELGLAVLYAPEQQELFTARQGGGRR